MIIEELLAKLRGRLEERADIRFALLFGSAATRGPARARDLDVAVSFAETTSWFELGRLEGDLGRATGLEADLVDLADASTLLSWEVLRTGRLIVASDPDAWRAFQLRVLLEWDDLRPYFDRQSAGLRRVLGVF